VAHLAAPLEKGESGAAGGVLEQGALRLRKAVHAHLDALRQVIEHGRQRPGARGFGARRALQPVEPAHGVVQVSHFRQVGHGGSLQQEGQSDQQAAALHGWRC
jgi:hypothetical protein